MASLPASATERRLVLDLDSTLIHSSDNMDQYEALQLQSDYKNGHLRGRVYRFDLVDVVDPPGSGIVTSMWGIFRPYVFEFLQFAGMYFKEVCIWSAGRHKYVHMIKDLLFSGELRPTAVFTYDHCKGDINTIHKPLTDLYTTLNSRGANETNTLALDDREDTFSLNRGNGIQIPRYEPEPTKEGIMTEDVALLQLIGWLSQPEVMRAADVRALDKSKIFATPLETYRTRLRDVVHHGTGVPALPTLPALPASPRSIVRSFFPSITRI